MSAVKDKTVLRYGFSVKYTVIFIIFTVAALRMLKYLQKF